MAEQSVPFTAVELQDEAWRSIPGYVGYEASTLGRVRSVPRTKTHMMSGRPVRRFFKGRILKATPNKLGYFKVPLGHGSANIKAVHHLVLRTFVGEAPIGHWGLHGDGKPANNRLNNLRWGTASENLEDSRRHGTLRVGTRHRSSKLTDDAVREIRASSLTDWELARKFNVHQSTLNAARNGKGWAHIKDVRK